MYEQQEAMKALKEYLISTLPLVKIDYSETAGAVVLGVDTSLEGYSTVLIQEDDNKKPRAVQ